MNGRTKESCSAPAGSSNPSVLDLCLSRGRITPYIETWTIDKNSGSDHATVGLRLDIYQVRANIL
jgi:hypothetical protein